MFFLIGVSLIGKIEDIAHYYQLGRSFVTFKFLSMRAFTT